MTGDAGANLTVCQDCNQLVMKSRNFATSCAAYTVVADRQQLVEGDERNMRAARRQVELFMDDGLRERLTVALALPR